MEAPSAISDSLREVASEPRIAIPSAPESCIETLRMPEPRPASRSGTPLIAIVSSGSIAVPMPSPISANGMNSDGK